MRKIRFILVTSGKGGVGKTIVAINLVKEINRRGITCGLLDGDIDDSNVMQLMGIKGGEIGLTEDGRFVPIIHDGMQIFAMPGISGTKPISMDGNEYSEIVRDVIEQSEWHSDYCVCDMPAGNADIFRTMILAFSDNLLGSIVVMQPAHAESARRILDLHAMTGIPVLGLIENMSSFKCVHGEEYPIFGASVLEDVAKEYGVEPLGRIPLSMEIKKAVEHGKPFLTGDSVKPIERAAEVVLAAKPVEVGELERIRERERGMARNVLFDVMAGLVGIVNTEIDIASYQRAYGFPGMRTIELDVCDRSLRKVNAQMWFRIEEGLLKVVKNPKQVETEIRFWDRAFIWSVLGWRPVGDRRVPFDFMDGWLLGEIKYFGAMGGTQQAMRFFRGLWRDLGRQVRQNKALIGLLEGLA